jgi:2-amino-4-hydroxy-6-hydroxymethyldihydropteridine diphosphokinase
VLAPLLEIAPDIEVPGRGRACGFTAAVAGQAITRLD